MGWRRERIQLRRDGRGDSILTDPEMCMQVLVESILVPEYESRVGLDYIVEDHESQGMDSELNFRGQWEPLKVLEERDST